jgi:hypothetical protein
MPGATPALQLLTHAGISTPISVLPSRPRGLRGPPIYREVGKLRRRCRTLAQLMRSGVAPVTLPCNKVRLLPLLESDNWQRGDGSSGGRQDQLTLDCFWELLSMAARLMNDAH